MESEGVLLSMIHEHVMMPWNDLRRGDCCGCYEAISDGYYCKTCHFFFHKKCVEESPHSIEHPSHSNHTLQLQNKPGHRCDLCRRRIKTLYYRCEICDFDMDLYCVKYPPPEVVDISELHHHKLTLYKDKKLIKFDCGAKCGNDSYGFPYQCHECDLAFHVDCVWHHPSEIKNPLEVSHLYHSLHPLKLLIGQPPEYSDGKCLLCGRMVDEIFYHCSSCNFTVDMCCVLNPPPQSLLYLKAHDHQLTLLLRLDSFTCNACGLKGDQSPYICVQCGFMIHQDCLVLPRLININRHDHRVSRTSKLGVVNSVCGVCHKKVNWIWGGYSCQKCPGYVVHSKCATRKDVWNGKELEGVSEEIEDINPYVVVDDNNTIQHFSHNKHYLRLQVNGDVYEENKRCNACSHPISFQSFYSCMEDCDFILHKKCAECPRKKRHVLHNDRLTLITSDTNCFLCQGCHRYSNGFRYQDGYYQFDVLCSSISELFVHPSHPEHPLYHIPLDRNQVCNNCNRRRSNMLSCIEDDCIFNICFGCVTLPQMVKHRVDDHPLSLCYGEKASGILWCDICEKTNSEKWFYTCKDHLLCLHTKCVIGDFSGFMPRSTIDIYGKDNEVVLNNSMTRPLCSYCKLRCIFPIILKLCGALNVYFCSWHCLYYVFF